MKTLCYATAFIIRNPTLPSLATILAWVDPEISPKIASERVSHKKKVKCDVLGGTFPSSSRLGYATFK